MKFTISHTNTTASRFGHTGVWGKIEIGSFKEDFISPISYWTKIEYQKHWLEQIHAIVSDNRHISCLITGIDLPQDRFVNLWALYRTGESVYFQNYLMDIHEEYASFDESLPHEAIPARQSFSEDGEKISEWQIPLVYLEDFLLAEFRNKGTEDKGIDN